MPVFCSRGGIKSGGIEFVYVASEQEDAMDLMVGVSSGVESGYQIGLRAPRRINGLFIAQPTIFGRFFGHMPYTFKETQIKRRLKVLDHA